jgi:hypothetical protein
MEEINEHELLKHCNLLNEKHEKLKEEILTRSQQNEMAIIELYKIEDEYKEIVEKLRLVNNTIIT